MFTTTRTVKKRVSNGSTALVSTARAKGRKIQEFAIAHKAITIAGAAALGALGIAFFVLSRIRNRA